MDTLLTSMLFVPGSDQHKLSKIPGLGAAAYILDLEDAVALSAKPAARSLVARFIADYGSRLVLHVRTNSVDSGYLLDDLKAIVGPGLAGVDLPKVASARDIHVADWVIGAFERERGLQHGSVELMATIESVSGVEHCDEISRSARRLRRMCFGAGDFALDARIDWPDTGSRMSHTLLLAKARLVMASRTAGLEPPHDGVYPNFRDTKGLEAEAMTARSLGFFGKHVIHPDQIPIVDSIFKPSKQQLERARRLVARFESAEAEGTAAIDFEGQLVDYPVMRQAMRLLEFGKETR